MQLDGITARMAQVLPLHKTNDRAALPEVQFPKDLRRERRQREIVIHAGLFGFGSVVFHGRFCSISWLKPCRIWVAFGSQMSVFSGIEGTDIRAQVISCPEHSNERIGISFHRPK